MIRCQISEHVLTGGLISDVTGIRLQGLIAKFPAYDPGGTCLPDPWWPAQQGSSGVGQRLILPVEALSELDLLLVPPDDNIVPIMQPLI